MIKQTKKLHLSELKVESFTTTINPFSGTAELKGGNPTFNNKGCASWDTEDPIDCNTRVQYYCPATYYVYCPVTVNGEASCDNNCPPHMPTMAQTPVPCWE